MTRSIAHVAMVVRDYDEAIAFFTGVLDFVLIEDTYIPEQDKRWVLVAPRGSSETSLLLARPSNPRQTDFIGNQTGGRVTFFLRTDDFWRDFRLLKERGVEWTYYRDEQSFRLIDEHFRDAPFERNLPVLLGLLWTWYGTFLGADTHAVIPYSQHLERFPAYLQQLDMESLGKSVDQDGEPVPFQTGAVVWGTPGTNGQHAYFQLLHQGTKLVPVDLIGFARPSHDAEGIGDIGCIAGLEGVGQELRLRLRTVEIDGRVEGKRFESHLDLLRHFFGALNVPPLRALVAAAQKDDENVAAPHEIDAIARPMIDPEFADASKELGISHESRLESNDSLGDALLCAAIRKLVQPVAKDYGLADFDHS